MDGGVEKGVEGFLKGERGEWRRFKWKGEVKKGEEEEEEERKRMWWALVGEAPSSLLAVFYYLHCRDVEDFFLSPFFLHLSPQITTGSHPSLSFPPFTDFHPTPPPTNNLHFNFNSSTPVPFPIPPPTKFSKIINTKRKCLFIFNNQT